MLIIKGIIIGIGKILPGVSGSMLAITLGLYDKIIEALLNIFNKKNIMFLLKLSLGFLIAIAIGANTITYFLRKYYLPTMLLFIGMIFGSQYSIYNKINNYKHLLLSIVTFIISLFLNSTLQFQLSNIPNFLKYFVLGSIETISTIIPGISGTAIFISLNVYEEILCMFSNILNINYILLNYSKVIPFILGVIVATILLIKVIDYILKKHQSLFFAAIIGFSISALYTMFKETLINRYSIIQILLGAVALMTGFILAKHLEKNENSC